MPDIGWIVVFTNATLTLHTDGPPHCLDEQAAIHQALDVIRIAAKERGIHFTLLDGKANVAVRREEI